MTFDLSAAILYEQSLKYCVARISPNPTPVPSARSVVHSYGYDKAKALGFLEAYRGACGGSMRLTETEWDDKWASKYPNTKYYKGE